MFTSGNVTVYVRDMGNSVRFYSEVESGPHCQDHFSAAISYGPAGLISLGRPKPPRAIPALEPALGSHLCVALPSAQVHSL